MTSLHRDHLCIDGPLDGSWVAWAGEQWSAPHVFRTPGSSAIPKVDLSKPETIKRTVYVARRWSTPERTFDIYAPEGMSDTEVFQRLLDHYRP